MSDVEKEVIEALLEARHQFRIIANYIQRPEYSDEGNRFGVAVDCSEYADKLEVILERHFLKEGLSPERKGPL